MVPWASAKAARTSKIQSDLAPGAQPPCGCLWQASGRMRQTCPLTGYCVWGGVQWLLWASKGQRNWDATQFQPSSHPAAFQKKHSSPCSPLRRKRQGQSVGRGSHPTSLPTVLPLASPLYCHLFPVTKAHHNTFSKLSEISWSINKRFW